jgi:hypothetical protein
MTGREQLRVGDMKLDLFSRANWLCKVCAEPLARYGTPQLAHRIPATKYNLKTYGKEVIHHRFNFVPVCSPRCNSSVLINNNPAAKDALLAEIRAALEEERSHGVQMEML